ncbi:MAG: hypothetical protein HY341_03000 [Candidatus Kerfeldbacteria bacterium]|nr:hypothetical protein [Candidatus Kerfeldbacteria bacterium]
MRRALPVLLMVVLLGGTAFAWTTVVRDFQRFAEIEGTVFKVRDCAVPNPVTTPCFYGAFAFAIALVWSAVAYQADADRARLHYRRLSWLLIAGTLFAWSVNGWELWKFVTRDASGPIVGCSGQLVSNPYTTPCFIGASIFLLSLIVGLLARRAAAPVPPGPSAATPSAERPA